jgi:hypothetical protein
MFEKLSFHYDVLKQLEKKTTLCEEKDQLSFSLCEFMQ